MEIIIGNSYSLDLGGIGPSTVIVLTIKNGRVYYKHYNGKLSDLSIEEFRELAA